MFSILVADDEEIERNAICDIIKKHCPLIGTMHIAENGLDALQKYNEYHPDIIFLDIKMPGKSGLEVAREIRKQSANQSIVFLTAYDYFDYAREAVSLKIEEYILKPASDDAIISILQTITTRLSCSPLDFSSFNIKKIQKEGQSSIARTSSEEFHSKHLYALGLAEIDDQDSEKNTIQGTEQQCTDLSARIIQLMQKVIIDMHANYMNHVSLEDAASSVQLSTFYFSKMFKCYTGSTYVDYLNKIRIQYAISFLKDARMSIKEIAARTGFSDTTYFCRVFKINCSETPTDYRNRLITAK